MSVRRIHSLEYAANAATDVAHFDIANPRARLGLLAWLATITAARTGADVGSVRFHSALHADVAQVQRVFDLQLSEQVLAKRLHIAPITLRRWFARAGQVRPCHFLQWQRLHFVARRMKEFDAAAAQICELLGFTNPDSIRRSLKSLAGLRLTELRTEAGQEEFRDRMAAAIEIDLSTVV